MSGIMSNIVTEINTGQNKSIEQIINESDFSPYTKAVVSKMLSSNNTQLRELPDKPIDTSMYQIYTYQSLLVGGAINTTPVLDVNKSDANIIVNIKINNKIQDAETLRLLP